MITNQQEFHVGKYESVWDSYLSCSITGKASYNGIDININETCKLTLTKKPAVSFIVNDLYMRWINPFDENVTKIAVDKGSTVLYAVNYGYDIAFAPNSGMNANVKEIINLDSKRVEKYLGQLSPQNTSIRTNNLIYTNNIKIMESMENVACLILQDTSLNGFSAEQRLSGTTRVK